MQEEQMSREKLTMKMDEETFDLQVARMLRNMFLSGLCFGAGLGGLVAIGAYTAVSGVIAGAVVWIAVRGWPWEL
jgi:hypothetical protein